MSKEKEIKAALLHLNIVETQCKSLEYSDYLCHKISKVRYELLRQLSIDEVQVVCDI